MYIVSKKREEIKNENEGNNIHGLRLGYQGGIQRNISLLVFPQLCFPSVSLESPSPQLSFWTSLRCLVHSKSIPGASSWDLLLINGGATQEGSEFFVIAPPCGSRAHSSLPWRALLEAVLANHYGTFFHIKSGASGSLGCFFEAYSPSLDF